jgi:predicted ATP-grasp superfamily ATP-dependent carboligase
VIYHDDDDHANVNVTAMHFDDAVMMTMMMTLMLM